MAVLVAVSLICMAAAVHCLPFRQLCPILPPMKDFDFNKFQGTWYEVARLPQHRGIDSKCHSETYTINPADSKLCDINATFVNIASNETQLTVGSARLDDPGPAGVFNYSFPSVYAWGLMIIPFTDYENYALVYSCKTLEVIKDEYGWILTRKRPILEEVKDMIIDKLKEYEVDPNTLQLIDQNNC